MGNNVSLVSAVTNTVIASGPYNSNLNALNNAASYTFTVGTITYFGFVQGSGGGSYANPLGISPNTIPFYIAGSCDSGGTATVGGNMNSSNATNLIVTETSGVHFNLLLFA